MKIITSNLPDMMPIGFVSSRSTYGTGLLTMFIGTFCEFFGIPYGMYSKKMEKAENRAMEALEKKAESLGADGVMDVRCEIHALSIMVYGTAYKLPAE
jgi:uncharacterized protein YbjQ (UPF0145 family)